MANALVNIPATAALGEIVEIKILIQHPMETGFRPRADGSLVPRNIITALRCTYADETVFELDLHPAIAANPFFALPLRATQTGEIVLEWTDWDGMKHRQSGQITVG